MAARCGSLGHRPHTLIGTLDARIGTWAACVWRSAGPAEMRARITRRLSAEVQARRKQSESSAAGGGRGAGVGGTPRCAQSAQLRV